MLNVRVVGVAIASLLLVGCSSGSGPSGLGPMNPAASDGSPSASPAGEQLVAAQILMVEPITEVGAVANNVSSGERRYEVGDCYDSTVTTRWNAYRCFTESLVFDPCFGGEGNVAICVRDVRPDGVIVAARFQVNGFSYSGDGQTSETGEVFLAYLDDGTVCRAATGAGPTAPAGYDGWRGSCEGPSGESRGVWWTVGVDPLFQRDGDWYVAYGPEGVTPPNVVHVERAYS